MSFSSFGGNGSSNSQPNLPSKELLNASISNLEKNLESASSASQLSKLLHQIEVRQSQTDDLLRRFCMKRTSEHESKVRSLEITRMELSSTLRRSRELKDMLDGANGLSSKITEKVRFLDAEKLKIQRMKDYVDNVRALKTEIQKASDFIEHKQWKDAATSIDAIRRLPPGLISDSFVESAVPTSTLPDMPEELLARWTQQLKETFVSEFNAASSVRNVERLTYFFQLFPLIGEEKLGLDCYSRFVCSIISEQSRAILRNIQGRTATQPDFYARILFQLYQTIAAIVSQHSRVIRKYYGDSVMVKILSEIQTECDLQSGLIFDTFWESKRIDEAVERVQQHSYPILVNLLYNDTMDDDSMDEDDEVRQSIDGGATPSLAEVGRYTDEISAMLNHWAMYCKFFVVTWNEAIGEPPSRSVYPRPLLLSPFTAKISDQVVTKFDILSTFAVRRTIEKACELEEVPSFVPQLAQCVRYLSDVQKDPRNSSNQLLHSLVPEEAPVSSMIDDLTMALNVILSEALSTGQLVSIKEMISNVKRILETDFLNVMERKLSKNLPKPGATLLTHQVLQEVQQSLDSNETKKSTPSAKETSFDAISRGSLLVKSINAAISLANEDGSESSNKSLANYVIALNSVSTFSSYLGTLSEHLVGHLKRENLLILDDQEYNRVCNELEADAGSVSALTVNLQNSKGTSERPSVQDRIETIIKSLSSGFSLKADYLIDDKIGLLFNQVLRGKLTKLINDTFREGAYMVSSEMLSSNLNDVSSAILTFIEEWSNLVIPYLTTLTRENFSLLIRILVSYIAANLESKLWAMNKKCNELGSASLEKDVSVLISEITKFDYSLRNDFVRVTQIIMLIGLDDDEEVDDLKDLEWALTPGERHRARNLRVDRKHYR
ncbi:DEKNAAC105215 [Brettanomyces naardenensis]|uniref:Conserved oligomeric Golgi complex subunit 4 n=1 Tax=Brettanomyces naardenensis TaxID=13370 RepID=A0A448YT08_BRENA|nr:DEKNAAC105215 [Brettanomyces naardenensis]